MIDNAAANAEPDYDDDAVEGGSSGAVYARR